MLSFIPMWAGECGFSIEVEGMVVTIRGDWDPVLEQPGHVIFGPDGSPIRIRGRQSMRSHVKGRDQRDPGRFVRAHDAAH
jgi:hypothetical protein